MMLEQRMMEGPERFAPRRSSLRRFNPMMIDEMAHMISKRSDDRIAILIIASLCRDDFPWLYEMGLEAYRLSKRGSVEHVRDALEAFRDAADATVRGPYMDEMGIGSKETHMMMRELPMLIDHQITRTLSRLGKKRGQPLNPRESKAGEE